MNFKTLFLVAALLAITPMCFAAQLFIDDFAIGAGVEDNTVDGNAVTEIDTIINNATRTASVDLFAGVIRANLDVAGNTAFLSQAGGASNAEFILAYDFSTSGGGILDFTDGGVNNLFDIGFLEIEGQTVFSDFSLSLNDGTNTQSINFATDINDAFGLNGAQGDLANLSFQIDFSDFDQINFANVTAFDIATTFTATKEIALDFISTNAVPEPGTYFMIALLGLVAFVRGRKKMAVENK